MAKYRVNEIYYTIQGEGVRYGIPHVFVRFAECNLACGFCDTEFESFVEMSAEEIYNEVVKLGGPCKNVMFCGGEPLLQLDGELISWFAADGYFIAVETNGTREIPDLIDWVACSPKVAEHAIKPMFVDELKYVRGHNQGIPRPSCKATHYLLSPIFEGNELDRANLERCIQLVKENPQWRLSIQHHKTSFGLMR
jgi:organic radical activating enzyme